VSADDLIIKGLGAGKWGLGVGARGFKGLGWCFNLEDPPKSPLKRGTLRGSVSALGVPRF